MEPNLLICNSARYATTQYITDLILREPPLLKQDSFPSPLHLYKQSDFKIQRLHNTAIPHDATYTWTKMHILSWNQSTQQKQRKNQHISNWYMKKAFELHQFQVQCFFYVILINSIIMCWYELRTHTGHWEKSTWKQHYSMIL